MEDKIIQALRLAVVSDIPCALTAEQCDRLLDMLALKNEAWQEEHAERLRLEERLKMAEAKIKIDRESRMPEFPILPGCYHDKKG